MNVDLSAAGIPRAAALTAFVALTDRWGVPKTQRHELLGQPQRTFYTWLERLAAQDTDTATLDPSTTERISHLIAIYNSLHRLIVGNGADAWMHAPNRAFSNQAPLDLLLNGRFEDLIDVRRYVETALRR
jgi:hypothetical protein